jgi:hypothetical protein
LVERMYSWMNRALPSLRSLKNDQDHDCRRTWRQMAEHANDQRASGLLASNVMGSGRKHRCSGVVRLRMKVAKWVLQSAVYPNVPVIISFTVST